MKYTRYDLNIKKRKGERKKMFVSILGVIVLALVVGVGLYRFIILPTMGENTGNKLLYNKDIINSGQNGENTGNDLVASIVSDSEKSKETSGSVVQNNGTENYIMVQCGVYSKEEGAKSILNQLQGVALGTIIEEDGKYRVVSYIGDEDKANSIATTLEGKNIAVSKAKFSILKSDNCNNKIAEMLNGYIQIINKLEDEGVGSIKTNEFKEWTNALEEDTNASNASIFKELKENINSLGEEVTKNDVQNSYNTIYKILANFRV